MGHSARFLRTRCVVVFGTSVRLLVVTHCSWSMASVAAFEAVMDGCGGGCKGHNGDHCDSSVNQLLILHYHLAFGILRVQAHRVEAVVT